MMLTTVAFEEHVTVFSYEHDDKYLSLSFYDYHMPKDLADQFIECLDVFFVQDNAFSYDILFNEKDADTITDFLRYVLSFDTVSPLNKFATIFSLFTVTETKHEYGNNSLDIDSNAYVFDVHNNSVVHDILTRQEISSEADYYEYRFHSNPLKAKNDHLFVGSLKDYNNRIGLFNYIAGMSNTFQEGIELGFYPPKDAKVNFDNNFLVFCSYVDFDGNGDKLIRLDKVKDAYLIFARAELMNFFNAFSTRNNDYINSRFVSWLLNTDLDALEAKESLLGLSVSSRITRMWLLYASDKIDARSYAELREFFTINFKHRFGSLCVWLGDNESKTKDVPLTLLLELFDDEIDNYEGVQSL